jgi:hypothetical protein
MWGQAQMVEMTGLEPVTPCLQSCKKPDGDGLQ